MKSLKYQIAYQIELKSVDDYFWKKNGKKILKSLDIKEVKTNGNWAVAFYKLSLGATEVKEAMFFFKAEDGIWVRASSYSAKKRCPSNWYQNMEYKINRFTKDSAEFDVLDL